MLRTALTGTTLALLLAAGPGLAAPAAVGGPATVIDGDTIEVHGTRLHLYGIDAPEAAQSCERATGQEYRCGREAARVLRERIGTAAVACERREGETQAQARPSAVCRAGGVDLGAWMVSQGYALASRRVTGAYTRQEGRAWATRRGIWAGTFEKPADWRRGRTRVEASAEP